MHKYSKIDIIFLKFEIDIKLILYKILNTIKL